MFHLRFSVLKEGQTTNYRKYVISNRCHWNKKAIQDFGLSHRYVFCRSTQLCVVATDYLACYDTLQDGTLNNRLNFEDSRQLQ
jgi:hypothetical protein